MSEESAQPRDQGTRTRTHALEVEIKHWSRITGNAGFILACPLCLTGYSKHDALYKHIRETEEAQHKALAEDLFNHECRVCGRESETLLRHMNAIHKTEYQRLMKDALRFYDDVEIEIPGPPYCFRIDLLVKHRRDEEVVDLPRKKRKPQRPEKNEDKDDSETNHPFHNTGQRKHLKVSSHNPPASGVLRPLNNDMSE
jgi:hypothetical protein